MVRLIGILKVSVANQLSIKPSVSGAIDVLEKDSVKHRADSVPGFVNVNRKPRISGRQSEHGKERQAKNSESADSKSREVHEWSVSIPERNSRIGKEGPSPIFVNSRAFPWQPFRSPRASRDPFQVPRAR